MTSNKPFNCFLDVVDRYDNFPRHHLNPEAYTDTTNAYYHLRVGSSQVTIGLMQPFVAEAVAEHEGWSIDKDASPMTLTLTGGHNEMSRTAIVATTFGKLRADGKFEILKQWRDQRKPAWNNGPDGEVLFSIERAAAPLLGIIMYGVHLLAYTSSDASNNDIKFWVQRRSDTVTAHADHFDNTAAGGVSIGDIPFETMIREASEEAELPEALVRKEAKPCGTLSYFHVRQPGSGYPGESGLLNPGVHFIYELKLPADEAPRSGPDVKEFVLWDVEQMKKAMLAGSLKPSFALFMLEFFIRHGIIHQGNEPDFVEISSRLHRPLEFPVAKSNTTKC
ncbi:thiamine pyrophosphokinase-related protein [Xylariaceae sp. FL1019]|nr:thiamine pyrophosphokinase-related protein [Xylariaceae sp. FL1019]